MFYLFDVANSAVAEFVIIRQMERTGLTRGILLFLTEYQRSYSDIRKVLYGKTNSSFTSEKFDASLKSILYRLKQKGLVKQDNKIWKITILGKKYLSSDFPFFKKIPIKNTRHKILVIFDIPEEIKRKRDWLRESLISLNFKMIQKSVWLGPAPLPKDFVGVLSELNLLKFIKFLEVRETDLV